MYKKVMSILSPGIQANYHQKSPERLRLDQGAWSVGRRIPNPDHWFQKGPDLSIFPGKT